MEDLRGEVARGRVIVVVGAGVSVGAAGGAAVASWTGLLEDGVARGEELALRPLPGGWGDRVRAQIQSGDVEELLFAAEAVTGRLGGRDHGEYRRWLRETVGALNVSQPAVLEALRDLGGVLATTNYDGLLEQVTGRPTVTWRDPARAQAVLRGDEQGILHLHGFWQEPGSVVLGVRSYEQLLGAEHAQAMQQAMAAMGTLLFVGFGAGLADPNFAALRAWMGRLFRGSEYRHFRLAKDDEVAALQAEHGQDERVFVLGYGPGHADLAPFLRGLTAAQPAPAPEASGPPPPLGPSGKSASPATSDVPPLVTETAHAPVDPADAEMLPSEDRRLTVRMPLPARAMRIGRSPDNDLVLTGDFEASRHHAELLRSPMGSYEIVDLGSHNGIFVNGKRESHAILTEQDSVSIGRSVLRLTREELQQFVDEGEVSFTVQDLVVRGVRGKILLDHVSFPVPARCLLGVIGPSRAGKSTLLGALSGIRPADTGIVLYGNRDLYRHYAELRHRIGFVPQKSGLQKGVLRTRLTARGALQYSAKRRFAADTDPSERDNRVDEVLRELDLTPYANTRLDRLSGGQRKLVEIAQELLTKPSLLFLDEPTSGFDPGLDTRIMAWLRHLAHDGQTVVVVTNSVDAIDKCDRLLVLISGGRVAFYGPPADGLSYFGQSQWGEVLGAFERYPDRDWAAEFAASPTHTQYMIRTT